MLSGRPRHSAEWTLAYRRNLGKGFAAYSLPNLEGTQADFALMDTQGRQTGSTTEPGENESRRGPSPWIGTSPWTLPPVHGYSPV